MIRPSGILASIAILAIGAGAYARSHRDDQPLEPSKGVHLSSRIACDGSTNPQDEIRLAATFSPGGWERSWKLDEFDEKYCKRIDLGFACVMPGHDRWRRAWSADSSQPSATGRYDLDSCYAWGSKDAPQYLLTGWYKEGGPESKLPWKQAEVKQVSSKPEVYEFADPNGGTVRLEINRP
jgi:hypothetical protein